jgi:hypothetical protein
VIEDVAVLVPGVRVTRGVPGGRIGGGVVGASRLVPSVFYPHRRRWRTPVLWDEIALRVMRGEMEERILWPLTSTLEMEP